MTDLILHPRRYPKHDDKTKGQVLGGECNRTACRRHRATWWNTVTHGFYCPDCARSINIPGAKICAPVDKKPTKAQMDDFHWKKSILEGSEAPSGQE